MPLIFQLFFSLSTSASHTLHTQPLVIILKVLLIPLFSYIIPVSAALLGKLIRKTWICDNFSQSSFRINYTHSIRAKDVFQSWCSLWYEDHLLQNYSFQPMSVSFSPTFHQCSLYSYLLSPLFHAD